MGYRATMAKARKKATSKTATRRTSRFVCPDCGFKAAHAMGLGRHRTSQHGVPSKRDLAGKRTGGGADRARIGRLERRVNQLEKRYEDLMKGLRRATSRKG